MSLKNPPRVHHTLAFRLTLWYAAVFTFSSCVAFLFFYFLITSAIRDRTDYDLSQQAEKFSTLLSINGIDEVKRSAILEAQAAGERKIFFRLLSLRGEEFSSSNMSYWRDIGVEMRAIRKLAEGSPKVFDTIVLPERRHKVRIFYALIGRGLILQLGQSMENYTRFIEAFRKIFISTMLLLVLLAALVGWFMARQALSGVGEITRTASDISSVGTLEKRVPVNPKGDEIAQLAGTFNQMLDRIQKLVKGIREMSDNIAHDLKSPVTRIRGIAEVTLTTESSVDAYRQMAASTIEECDRLLDIINTGLLISKTESGVGQIIDEEVDMVKVIQDACELFEPLAEDKGIKLIADVPDQCLMRGDMRMIQRMIANLLDNALKYTPHEGTVDISCKKVGEKRVTATIKDTGIGISAEDLPHIFERFFRVDASRPQTGAGLGLSLAQAIAYAHGGQIAVTSTPGRGSTFTVRLQESI
ncbi:ATP-binding protein [Thermodesulfobacteriota bacterium]